MRIRRKSRRTFNGHKKFSKRAIRKANRRRGRSGLEKQLHGWLRELEIPFKIEQPIGECHVDILVGDSIAIEANGCYWHRHTCSKIDRPDDDKIRTKDLKRYAFFQSLGYKVHVIWECDVKKRPEQVKRLLMSLEVVKPNA